MGDSRSISIELRPLMADKFESRFRCSGGRLRGWRSRSAFFFLRDDEVGEPGALFCLAKVRLERGLTSRAACGVFATRVPFCGLEGLEDDFVGDLSGEVGSEYGMVAPDDSSSESSVNFACFLGEDFLENSGIESAGTKRALAKTCAVFPAPRTAWSGGAAAKSGLGKLFGGWECCLTCSLECQL
jgi:hypothetical protein